MSGRSPAPLIPLNLAKTGCMSRPVYGIITGAEEGAENRYLAPELNTVHIIATHSKEVVHEDQNDP